MSTLRPYAHMDRLELKHPNYTVLVEAFAFGQYRIRLTDKTQPDSFAPAGHGGIVRELCTYHASTAYEAITVLAKADDPLAYCKTLERPYNCEHEGGRIRLDNEPGRIGEAV